MLDLLLCGAADTRDVRDEFVRVVEGMGGNPLHYLSGDILYVNAATSTWETNSQASVRSADLCVFVIMRALGTITWQTEFREVVLSGTPFLVLCLDETYERYRSLASGTLSSGPSGLSDADEMLMARLSVMEREHQITIVSFSEEGFADVLRRQLGTLFAIGLQLLESQNRRRFLRTMFTDASGLSAQQLDWTTELALDEMEDKGLRKQAVRALAECRAASEETTLALLDSPEQGVQRQAFQSLDQLYVDRPPDPDFLRSAVEIANQSDDVGIGRRLVTTLFDFDVGAALVALAELELTDVGRRRRITDQLEARQGEIGASGLMPQALVLARRCQSTEDSRDWKARLKAFIARYSEHEVGQDPGASD